MPAPRQPSRYVRHRLDITLSVFLIPLTRSFEMVTDDCASQSSTVGTSAPAAPVAAAPASLLFSLQFYVDRVSVGAVEASNSAPHALLLAFQLLQYEIVLFDAQVQPPDADKSEMKTTRLAQGKSCLFEADPDELARELQQERDAPLTLLLLEQERGRARLRAFAGVPLALHVGLLVEEGDVLSRSMLHRVCEWAMQSGRWELRDHCNQSVGWVDGVVTLSCLGKALAPHLVHALGVQVSKSQPSSPRGKLTGGEEKTEESAVDTATEEEEMKHATAVKEERTEKLDSSVQCDEDMLVEDVTKSTSASLSVQSSNGGIQLYGKGKELRTRTDHKSSARPRHTDARHYSRTAPRVLSTKSALFSRELPPPLFFQKAPRPKQ